MTNNAAGWRDRLRRRGFTQLVDQALEIAFTPDDDVPFVADEVEETPRLARGIVWSDLVAEMERDWAASQHTSQHTTDHPQAA